MKNKLTDLNDHLFAQLERLGNENIKPDQLKTEIDRSKALAQVAAQVIGNAGLVLQAQKYAESTERPHNAPDLPAMLKTDKAPRLERIK